MKFTSLIDNYHSAEWELSLQEAYVFSWIYDVPSWAKTLIIGTEVWYFAAKPKAISDIPLLTDKVDTMYRFYKKLEEKGLIENKKVGKEDYIRITEKGKQWNSLGKKSEYSENNPTQLGKKSELSSEKNPTYYTITNTDYSISNKEYHVDKENFSEKENTEKNLGEDVAKEAVNLLRSLMQVTKGIKPSSKPIKAKYNLLTTGEDKVSPQEARELILAHICLRVIAWKGTVWKDGTKAEQYLKISNLFGTNKFIDTYLSDLVKALEKNTLDEIKQQAFMHVGLNSNNSEELGLEMLATGLNHSNYKQRLESVTQAIKSANSQEEHDFAKGIEEQIRTSALNKGWSN